MGIRRDRNGGENSENQRPGSLKNDGNCGLFVIRDNKRECNWQ